MLESIQQFLQMDDPTFTFAGWYYSVGILLAGASLAFHLLRGNRKPAKPQQFSGPRAERPPLASAAVSFGRRFVSLVAESGITPNQITVIGLVLVLFNCGLFLWSHNSFWFGSGLIAALLFDTLDGLVARHQGTSSLFGGYLDAIIDRYEEVAIYLTVAVVLDAWLVSFLIFSGSMLTSYAKARTAIEIPVANKGWGDFLEKPTRLFILCTGLIGAPVLPWFLPVALWMLAAMTHFTALQRFARARFMLRDTDAAQAAARP